jgi:hypothetical protein
MCWGGFDPGTAGPGTVAAGGRGARRLRPVPVPVVGPRLGLAVDRHPLVARDDLVLDPDRDVLGDVFRRVQLVDDRVELGRRLRHAGGDARDRLDLLAHPAALALLVGDGDHARPVDQGLDRVLVVLRVALPVPRLHVLAEGGALAEGERVELRDHEGPAVAVLGPRDLEGQHDLMLLLRLALEGVVPRADVVEADAGREVGGGRAELPRLAGRPGLGECHRSTSVKGSHVGGRSVSSRGRAPGSDGPRSMRTPGSRTRSL